MTIELTENLTSAKNQLSHVNEALDSNLELWERKEYETVKASLIEDIDSLEHRLQLCF